MAWRENVTDSARGRWTGGTIDYDFGSGKEGKKEQGMGMRGGKKKKQEVGMRSYPAAVSLVFFQPNPGHSCSPLLPLLSFLTI